MRRAGADLDYWTGVLEYRFLPGEKKMHDRHRPIVETALDALRRRYLDYAEALLVQYRPSVRGRTVRLTKLIERGLTAHEPKPVDIL